MSDAYKVFWIVLAAAIGVLVYLLAPVLTPFLIALGLAYLGNPLVARLQGRGLSRTLAVTLVFGVFTLLLLAVVLLLLPALVRQTALLIERIPVLFERIQDQFLPWLEAQTGLSLPAPDLAQLAAYARAHWQQAGGAAAALLAGASRTGLTLLGWLGNLVLIPVVTFYLMRDWEKLLAGLHEALPRRSEPAAVRLIGESDRVLGAFMRGQLMVMVALAVVYSIGLAMVGLDLALLIGSVAGLVSFVPYLGFAVGILAAGVAALMQFHELWPLVGVFVVFAVGQLLEGFVLTPLLLGDRIGLHPVAVIFAVLAGGQLFGFVGVLLGLPAAAVILVLLRFAHERYLASSLYAD